MVIWKNRAATSVGTAEGMKFTQPHVWRSGVLCGLALALGACGTTYGTGTNPGAQTVKDLTGMLSLGGGGSGPAIAYEARPRIVPPPANAALPAPGSGETVQNWPTDPDVLAREQKLANANQRAETGDALVDPGFRLPKQKVEVVNEEVADPGRRAPRPHRRQQEGTADAVRQGEGRRCRTGRRQRQPGPDGADRAAGRLPDSRSVGARGIRGDVEARSSSRRRPRPRRRATWAAAPTTSQTPTSRSRRRSRRGRPVIRAGDVRSGRSPRGAEWRLRASSAVAA